MSMSSVRVVTAEGSCESDTLPKLFNLERDYVNQPRARRRRKTREGEQETVAQPAPRSVDAQWSEKLQCIVDNLQIYALVWSASQAWAWPQRWTSGSRVAVLFNVDTIAWGTYSIAGPGAAARSVPVPVWGFWERPDSGSLWSSYVAVASAWACVPLLLATLYRFGGQLHHGRNLHLGATIRKWSVRLAEFLYVPTALGMLRLACCEQEGAYRGKLSVDPTLVCGTMEHVAPLVICAILAVVFLVGLPVFLGRHIRKRVVYHDAVDHEFHLVCVEGEYLLELDDAWHTAHVSLYSSFRRQQVYYRVWTLGYKLLMVLIYLFVRVGPPTSSGHALMALCMALCIGAWSVQQTVWLPYRCMSSNILALAMSWPLSGMAFFGWMKASQIRSPLVLDTTLSAINVTLCVLALTAIVSGIAWTIGLHKEKWPTWSACGAHSDDAAGAAPQAGVALSCPRGASRKCLRPPLAGLWFSRIGAPTENAKSGGMGGCIKSSWRLVVHDEAVGRWLNLARRAQALIDRCTVTPKLIMPVDHLKEIAEAIRPEVERAESQGHILGVSLRRLLEQATAFDVVYRPGSVLPKTGLQGSDMQQLRQRLDQREEVRILAGKSRTGVLFKLLALRSWVGNRPIAASDRLTLSDELRFTIETVNASTYHVKFRAGPLFLKLADTGALGDGAAEPDEPGKNLSGLDDDELALAFARQRQLSVAVNGFVLPMSGRVGPAEACKRVQLGHFVVAVNQDPLDGMSFEAALEKVAKATWPKTLTFVVPPTVQTPSAPSVWETDSNALGVRQRRPVSSPSATPDGAGGSTFAASAGVVGKSWEELLQGHHVAPNMSALLDETWAMCRQAKTIAPQGSSMAAAAPQRDVDFGLLYDHRARIRDCILEWETDFAAEHKRRPKRKDQVEIQQWYECADAATQALPLRLRH